MQRTAGVQGELPVILDRLHSLQGLHDHGGCSGGGGGGDRLPSIYPHRARYLGIELDLQTVRFFGRLSFL